MDVVLEESEKVVTQSLRSENFRMAVERVD